MEYYRPELDGLRAIAVVSVLLLHVDANGPFPGGFIGVDLFFVLSSFLITSILASEWRDSGRIDLARFYWRRFFRLTPALFLLLAVYLAIAPFIWPGYPHSRDAVVAGLYRAHLVAGDRGAFLFALAIPASLAAEVKATAHLA